MGGRLLERLQEGVEGRAPRACGPRPRCRPCSGRAPGRTSRFPAASRISSTPLFEAASISSTSTGAPEAKSGHAGISRRPRARCARGAGERLGEEPRGGGLADAARPREEIGVGDAPGREGVAQRAGDGLLPDDRVEGLRPPLPREDLSTSARGSATRDKTVHPQSNRPYRDLRTNLLRSGTPTAHGRGALPLLPSGPGGVRHFPSRGAQPSTPSQTAHSTRAALKGEFNPAVADCGLQGTATSPSSTAHRKRAQNGGGGGIRTHGTVARTRHFQCRTFGHSATPPHCSRFRRCWKNLAEGRGFEPPRDFAPLSDFESDAFNRARPPLRDEFSISVAASATGIGAGCALPTAASKFRRSSTAAPTPDEDTTSRSIARAIWSGLRCEYRCTMAGGRQPPSLHGQEAHAGHHEPAPNASGMRPIPYRCARMPVVPRPGGLSRWKAHLRIAAPRDDVECFLTSEVSGRRARSSA